MRFEGMRKMALSMDVIFDIAKTDEEFHIREKSLLFNSHV